MATRQPDLKPLYRYTPPPPITQPTNQPIPLKKTPYYTRPPNPPSLLSRFCLARTQKKNTQPDLKPLSRRLASLTAERNAIKGRLLSVQEVRCVD